MAPEQRSDDTAAVVHAGDDRADAVHATEDPSEWGWHAEFGVISRIGGWLVVGLLLILLTTTHYNRSGDLWLYLMIAGLVVTLLWDIQRRKHSWRR